MSIGISAQVSLYPLGSADLADAINAFLAALQEHGLEPEVGAMSTIVAGDSEQVFGGLQKAFERVAEANAAVLVVTISNACPVRKK